MNVSGDDCFKGKPFLFLLQDKRDDRTDAVIIPFAKTQADGDLEFCFVKSPLRV